MPGEIGASVYGGARALQDFLRERRAQESHETEQEVRTQALSQHRQLQPLRMRAAEVGLEREEYGLSRARERAPQEDELLDLQTKIAQLQHKTTAEAAEQARELQTKSKRLTLGVAKARATGNWSHLTEAMKELFPETFKNSEVKRNDADNSLSLIDEQGKEVKKFSGKRLKDRDGNPTEEIMSPDDELTFFAQSFLDPIGHVNKKFEQWKKLQEEEQKGETRLAVAEEGTRRAEVRAAAAGDRESRAKLRLGMQFVDKIVRTKDVPGHYQLAFSNTDDANLMGHIERRLGELIRGGMPEERAALEAVSETREAFFVPKTQAFEAAKALVKKDKKFNPRDAAAVTKAAAAGDPDAKKLVEALKKIKTRFDPRAQDEGEYARRVINSLPTKP